MTQDQEQHPRMGASYPDTQKRMKHADSNLLTAQPLQDVSEMDLIKDLHTGTQMGFDPLGHQTHKARPDRRSAQLRPKGNIKPATGIDSGRPWYEVQPLSL